MPITIEDILNIACSSAKLTLSNEFQKVFVLSTSSDARIAYDVLVSHGFEVKVYHQDDNTSKLYVAHPKFTPQKLESILTSATAYITALRQTKNGLDELCKNPASGAVEYNIAFANMQPSGKQVIIQIFPADRITQAAPPAALSSTASAVAQNASSSTHQTKKHLTKPKDGNDEFSSGPAVGRGKYPGAPDSDGTVPDASLKRKILLYLFGNMATSSFTALIMVVILAALFSIFVFAKAFICPDFASMKRSSAWYCHNDDDDSKNSEQQKQIERQKKIGLVPPTPSDAR